MNENNHQGGRSRIYHRSEMASTGLSERALEFWRSEIARLSAGRAAYSLTLTFPDPPPTVAEALSAGAGFMDWFECDFPGSGLQLTLDRSSRNTQRLHFHATLLPAREQPPERIRKAVKHRWTDLPEHRERAPAPPVFDNLRAQVRRIDPARMTAELPYLLDDHHLSESRRGVEIEHVPPVLERTLVCGTLLKPWDNLLRGNFDRRPWHDPAEKTAQNEGPFVHDARRLKTIAIDGGRLCIRCRRRLVRAQEQWCSPGCKRTARRVRETCLARAGKDARAFLGWMDVLESRDSDLAYRRVDAARTALVLADVVGEPWPDARHNAQELRALAFLGWRCSAWKYTRRGTIRFCGRRLLENLKAKTCGNDACRQPARTRRRRRTAIG